MSEFPQDVPMASPHPPSDVNKASSLIAASGADMAPPAVAAAAAYPRNGMHVAGGLPALHSLRRRWTQMACAGAVCAAVLAGASWFYFQPKFLTYASLRIHSETPRLAFVVNEAEHAAQFEVYKRTQRELVLGDEVLLAALRNPKLADSLQVRTVAQSQDPVVWLRQGLRVSFPGDAEIMSISLEGDDPGFIATAVNAVLDAYVENVIDAGKQHRSDRLAELRRVLSVQEEKARRLRSKLESLTESLGSGDADALSVKQQVAIQRFAQLQTEYGRVQFERLSTELKLARLGDRLKQLGDKKPDPEKDRKASGEDDSTQDAEGNAHASRLAAISPLQLELQVERDPAVVAQLEVLRQAVQALENASALLREDQVGALKTYHSRIEQEQQVLEKLKESVRDDLARFASEEVLLAEQRHYLEMEREFERLQGDLQTLQVHEKVLADRLAEATEAADRIGTSSVNVELTRKELDRLEKINDRISVEIETLTIELSSASRVEALSRAREPKARSKQERIRKATTFGVLGFLLPCAGLMWLDGRRRLINGEAEIQQLATVRLLGSIPLMPRPYLGRRRPQRNALALREAVDRIRTVLIREAELSDYRVIQITSAIAGEAKTTFACQLATSLARAHRRTVLVDFDMRCPSVHEAFGRPMDVGLSDVLRMEATLDEVLLPVDQEGLWFISAGRCDRIALAALTTGVVEEVIVRLREQFEFVVIDSSPVLPVVDALLVAQQSDATILTALRDVSRAPNLLEAEERLRQVGANVVGSVVTTKGDHSYYQTLDRYALV